MFQTTNQSLDDQKDVRKRSKKGGIEQMWESFWADLPNPGGLYQLNN